MGVPLKSMVGTPTRISTKRQENISYQKPTLTNSRVKRALYTRSKQPVVLHEFKPGLMHVRLDITLPGRGERRKAAEAIDAAWTP